MTEVNLRRATGADGPEVAEVWLRSFAAALPTVRRAHSDDAVRRWVTDVLLSEAEVWVAESEGAAVGMMALHDGWIEQLYLDPDWRGRGIGDRFVQLAKARFPDGLELWTFQVNAPARRFYARHGFKEADLTDGSGNQEREPDVRCIWRPTRAG